MFSRERNLVYLVRLTIWDLIGTPRGIEVDSTWIVGRYVEDQISTNLYVISTCFFDAILLIEKSTLFPRLFFF